MFADPGVIRSVDEMFRSVIAATCESVQSGGKVVQVLRGTSCPVRMARCSASKIGAIPTYCLVQVRYLGIVLRNRIRRNHAAVKNGKAIRAIVLACGLAE